MKDSNLIIDCTLRDGGYYNAWDFDGELVRDYLDAMHAVSVDYVELGFRSLQNSDFKGAFAFTTDSFIRTLPVPDGLKLGVMVNSTEIAHYSAGIQNAVQRLFRRANESPIELVRLATHYRDLEATLQSAALLKDWGYRVGVNLMQISERTPEELEHSAGLAQRYSPDVFYLADSMGCLVPEQLDGIIARLRNGGWSGAIGIHAHDNLGNALANTSRAFDQGATWLDCTVTGMGRGPGNTKTEYLTLELAEKRGSPGNPTALLSLIRKHFAPLKALYNWGTNPYYYLAGKHGIHPTYIQEMLCDIRYSDEDILAVIQHLQRVDAKSYDATALEAGRHFYSGNAQGSWDPGEMIDGREVLIVGAGPSAATHATALEDFIRKHHPFVIALNTQDVLPAELIDIRAACHPVRMLADCRRYGSFPQPLVTPASMLLAAVREALNGTRLLDYGLSVEPGNFVFRPSHCVIPTSLVAAYALAIATSGRAVRILLAGFDGYSADDPRRVELDELFELYTQYTSTSFASVTPTRLEIPSLSIYAL